MGINNFKKPINERAGVAEASLFYVDPIFSKVWNEFLEFYQSDEDELEEDYHLSYSRIKPYITDKISYVLFPVVGIEVNLTVKRMSAEKLHKKYRYISDRRKKEGKNLTYSVGGWAVNFGHRNWSGYSRMANPVREISDHGIILYCGISIDMSDEFDINKCKNKVQDEIEEVIWHELNHLYEYYQRVLSTRGKITARGPQHSITASDVNRWGIPKDIYDYWSYNFTYFLYSSEPHELRAVVQEAAYWVTRYGFNTLEKSGSWFVMRRMENFKADEFLKGLDEQIDKYLASKSEETTALRKGFLSHPSKERLKNMWVQQYKKSLETYKESPTVPIERLSKMKCDEFVKFFEGRIQSSGTYLKKKLVKLWQLRKDDTPDEEIY